MMLTVTIGSFTFEWDRPGRQIIVWRGDDQVATIPHVYEPEWIDFKKSANPYQGPG